MTERDEASGLDHTWFRKHENRAGRWTSPDPYNGSMNIVNPQSFNRYSYVSNQPTNFIDPSGLQQEHFTQRICRWVEGSAFPQCVEVIVWTMNIPDPSEGAEPGIGGGADEISEECGDAKISVVGKGRITFRPENAPQYGTTRLGPTVYTLNGSVAVNFQFEVRGAVPKTYLLENNAAIFQAAEVQYNWVQSGRREYNQKPYGDDTAEKYNETSTIFGNATSYDAPGVAGYGLTEGNMVGNFEAWIIDGKKRCSIKFHVGIKTINGVIVQTTFGKGYIDLNNWLNNPPQYR